MLNSSFLAHAYSQCVGYPDDSLIQEIIHCMYYIHCELGTLDNKILFALHEPIK